MANFGRVKTWGNETLQAADLNAEFDNVINNVTSGSVSSANIDLTDGYAWTGAHTFSVDMKVLNGAGLIVGNTAQGTTSSAGELQVLGTAAADSTAIIGHWAAAASGGTLSFLKSRNATIGSSTIVQDNDVLGTIEFMADDGSDFATPAASIFSRVNGTPGANDMPGELVLAVTADSGNSVTERVRVLQNGTVELNSATLSFDAAASSDTSGNNNLGISAGTADVQITASNLTPASNDGSALGVSGTAWSDLFLASGAVANWNAGDITLTHSAGKLTFGGDGAVELDFNNHEMTNVDIDSGAIDGTIIGAASAAAGSFAAIVGTSLDINGAADISGDLTLSAGADGALTFANAGENSIKIPDNQASALIVEEANNAYLTFVTTNSGEKITLGKKLEAGSVEIEGSAFDINGGNIDGATIGAASAAAGTFTTITGSGNISFDGGSFVFNESGADKDFRIEGDTNANLFVADASLDSIGIGTNAPGQASLTGLGWSYQPLFHVHSSGPTLSYSGALDLRFIDTSAGSNAKVGDIHYEDQTWRFRTVNDSGSEVNANVLFVDGAGAKIGIGTDSPDEELHVVGQVEFTQSGDTTSTLVENTHASYSSPMNNWTAARAATDAYEFLRAWSNYPSSSDLEFRLKGDGNAYADGAWNDSGADYQEFFESSTGAALEVGVTVVMVNDKVRASTSDDSADEIIGVVRPKADNKNSAVVGNTAWNHWTEKYLTDDWGVYLREDVEVWTYTENGEETAVYAAHQANNWTPPEGAVKSTQSVRKLNPNFNPAQNYQPREDRAEWNLIGLLGQIQIKKGETVNPRWVKMKDISGTVELWYCR